MITLLATLLAVVTAPYAPVSYACDGSTTAYTVNFPYLTQTDLFVTSTTGGGAVTNLVLTTDYSLNASSTTSTAVLTLQAGSRCPNGSTLKIARNMSITQPQVFRQQTSFNPQTVEATADRCVMQEQQIQAQFAGTQNVNFGGLNTFTATQTFAPAAGSDAVVATGSGTGRAIVATSVNGTGIVATSSGTGVPIVATSSATSGVATQFATGNAVNGPVQIVGQATDPTTPANGEVWVNSAQGSVKARVGGVTQQISGNPFLLATSTAGQSIPNSTNTTIVFGTVVADTDSAYNNTTGIFTVPAGKGGHYSLTCSIGWNAGFTASQIILAFQQNGGLLFQSVAANPVATQTQNVVGVAKLTAGDLIKCTITQNQGGAELLHTPAASVFMSIKRLSD